MPVDRADPAVLLGDEILVRRRLLLVAPVLARLGVQVLREGLAQPVGNRGRYTVRTTLTLSVPTGSSSVRWSDAFVESIFPASERSRTFTKELEFGSVRPRGVVR
jgi:hypothetical protein